MHRCASGTVAHYGLWRRCKSQLVVSLQLQVASRYKDRTQIFVKLKQLYDPESVLVDSETVVSSPKMIVADPKAAV